MRDLILILAAASSAASGPDGDGSPAPQNAGLSDLGPLLCEKN